MMIKLWVDFPYTWKKFSYTDDFIIKRTFLNNWVLIAQIKNSKKTIEEKPTRNSQ